MESKIVAATLFSDSAHVTRRLAGPAEKGPVRVALAGLPARLDPARLRVTTSAGVLRAIETDLVEAAADPANEAAALREQLTELRTRIHRLVGELEALRLELQLLEQVTPTPTPGQPSPAPLRPAVFLAGLDVLAARRRDATILARRLELERDETRRRIDETERRLALTGATSSAERRQQVLVLALDADGAAPTLEVTYDAAWATWRPYYHVRLNGRDNTVECVRFADVWQETGEDWTDVKLRLSTAVPEGALFVPAVLPWTLGVAKSYEDKVSDLYAQQRRRKADDGAPEKKPTAPRVSRAMMVPPPQPAMSRGGLLSNVFGGGGAPAPASMDVVDDDASADLVMPSELAKMQEITREVAIERAARDDDHASYARQFEEEGIYASRTSSGLAGMRAEGGVDGAPGGWGDPAATLSDAPPYSPPPPSVHARGPAPEHPDRARLLGARTPHDASGGIDFELELGGTASLPSGRERQRLSLGSVSYPAKIEYLLRPAVKDHAFGRVTVVNSEPVPMLAGPAAIFVGDAFFGETAIETTPAGGKLVLELGAETSIKSARRTKTSVRTEGLLTKEDIHVVEVLIEIESFLPQTVELEVQDQVPLSRDSKIEVKLVKKTPKDAILDELTGIVTFRTSVVPGARTELSLVYELQAPKDYQLRQTLSG
ncbi:DUF4139 domain-containing protein [Myxococcota bacterium]|nr:DUF4139 domain-containing protein [Myxococcota bacterium]